MEKGIPKHHVKQTICATRPAYREGRIPKAVKVYTINNESKYILIQGVPALGAMKDLIQLCSSYGDVEEHHALDEYPCEDKYTEVYLIKYKKIQSARFAKRKLDDYSFFGGNLHVCYAPEYESVSETREKLQDRRRVISFKIKNHKKEYHAAKDTVQVVQSSNTPSMSSTIAFNEAADKSKSHSPSSSTDNCDYISTGKSQLMEKNELDTSHSQLQFQTKHNEEGDTSQDISQETFQLPPPPKQSVYKKVESKFKYEYSRVPSKHSTLPVNYDGRLAHQSDRPEKYQCVKTTITSSTTSNNNETNSTSPSPSEEILRIKKDFVSHKQALKFVPRQAVKRKCDISSNDAGINTSSDIVDKKIRQNAFVLGDQQGPADLPGRRQTAPEITPGASRSYNDTIKSIRGKISQVITDSLMSKK